MKLPAIIILFGVLGLFLNASSLNLYSMPPSTFNQPVSYYQCIRWSVNNRIIIPFRYYIYYVEPDLENIKNALAAGLNVEIIITPTRCRDADEELLSCWRNLRELQLIDFGLAFNIHGRNTINLVLGDITMGNRTASI